MISYQQTTNTDFELRRAAAEGYTLAGVIAACRACAKQNFFNGEYEGNNTPISNEEMADKIFGYVEYHGGYMYGGERWFLNEDSRPLYQFGEHRWSRIGESSEVSGDKEQLVKILKDSPVGTKLNKNFSMGSRESETYKKTEQGFWVLAGGFDDSLAQKEECGPNDLHTVARIMGVPVSGTFQTLFMRAIYVC